VENIEINLLHSGKDSLDRGNRDSRQDGREDGERRLSTWKRQLMMMQPYKQGRVNIMAWVPANR